MPLDLCVIGKDGAPGKTVPLTVELHKELVDAGSANGLLKIQILDNYYEDAEIAVQYLDDLLAEVGLLRTIGISADLQLFLDYLLELIKYALANGNSLHAIAD
ncbi:hypothetical protein [Aestuariivirga sp.]|uniref:hypothetical protein n=1 Tax=Aestuariivirga sp. TaxID=2650926 RepID=UPI003BACD85F